MFPCFSQRASRATLRAVREGNGLLNKVLSRPSHIHAYHSTTSDTQQILFCGSVLWLHCAKICFFLMTIVRGMTLRQLGFPSLFGVHSELVLWNVVWPPWMQGSRIRNEAETKLARECSFSQSPGSPLWPYLSAKNVVRKRLTRLKKMFTPVRTVNRC